MSNNDDSRVPSVFASLSWEPRFAVDGTTDALIQEALQLHAALRHKELAPERVWFDGVVASPSRIIVRARRADHSLADPPWELRNATWRFVGLALGPAVADVARWLDSEALFPPSPWFDGGEARGFQAWQVAHGMAGVGPVNTLVLEPKWFEIHK